ncbi:MAG: 5-(carboxyamino)imidazole ribonucleotide synthase [Halobacteria archaeon]
MNLESEPETLGVIGGGQLCRMICEAASPLGVEVVFLDPTPDAPAKPVADEQIVGDFDDFDPVSELVEKSDYLTYDIELASPDVVEVEAGDVPVYPDPETLRTIQDKYVQKEALVERGVPVPRYRNVEDVDDLHEAADELGLPLMLKAREGGYDGRGNVRVESRDEFEEALENLPEKVMVEEFLDYSRELSVIAIQGDGEIDSLPLTETIHEEQILRRTVTPARTSDEVEEEAREVAGQVLEAMEGRGVYGIEMFEVDGEVLVNEIAPRPHNSGHWSIEGAVSGQFEQHVRAVTGKPIGSTELRSPNVSHNILGSGGPCRVNLGNVEAILDTPRAHLHWYGKKEERPLRKMGHYTLTGDEGASTDELLEEAKGIRSRISFE